MSLNADLCVAAARNNATWCDAMARVHGAPGTFGPAAWINRRPAPRFHPNLVTLGGPGGHSAQMDAVRHLMAAPPAPGWAVKDSFAALDLAPLGFHRLFWRRSGSIACSRRPGSIGRRAPSLALLPIAVRSA